MNLYIVRHGETDYNKMNLMQGSSNIPLNFKGKNQALDVSKKLENVDIDLVITSPLVRTKETASIIIGNKNVKIITDDRIVERGMGILEGKDRSLYDVKKYWDYKLNYYNSDKVEKISDLFLRTKLFLDDIKNKYSDKNILIVSHAATIRALYFNIVGFNEDDKLHEFFIDNCCILNYKL